MSTTLSQASINRRIHKTEFDISDVSDDIAKWEMLSLSTRFIDEQMDYFINNYEKNIQFKFYSGLITSPNTIDNYIRFLFNSAKGVVAHDGILTKEDIQSFKYLIWLICPDTKGSIKIFNPKQIRILSIYRGQNFINLSDCGSMEHLSLWGCSNILDDRNVTKNLSKVGFLEMVRPSLTHLDALSDFGLRYLKIYYASKLQDISGLRGVCSSLKAIHLQSCNKINDMMYLSTLKNLDYLHIENCSDIETISFIDNMPNLRRIHISGTNILDGDVFRYMEKYKNILYVHPMKRHYR